MMAYGYEWSSEKRTPGALREATLACTKEELDNLIWFLNQVKEDIDNRDAIDEGEHWHFRDWDDEWTVENSDFIFMLMNQRETK